VLCDGENEAGMASEEQRWIEVNGARLRYELRRGDNTIVLLHEMGGTLESFDALLPHLSEGYGVLRYDQRGAGLSSNATAPLAIDTPADDLAALLDALSIGPPVAVIGAAVGAAVGIRFAARVPQRVAALVLLAPAAGIAPARRAATLEKIEQLERHGTPTALGGAIRLDAMSYGATYRMLLGLDLEADMRCISAPTLALAGTRDSFRPPLEVAALAGRIAGARFRTLESGHVMAVETPSLVAAEVTAFLARIGFAPGSRRHPPVEQ